MPESMSAPFATAQAHKWWFRAVHQRVSLVVCIRRSDQDSSRTSQTQRQYSIRQQRAFCAQKPTTTIMVMSAAFRQEIGRSSVARNANGYLHRSLLQASLAICIFFSRCSGPFRHSTEASEDSASDLTRYPAVMAISRCGHKPTQNPNSTTSSPFPPH